MFEISRSNGAFEVFGRRFTKSRLWDITRRYNCAFFNLLGGMSMAIYREVSIDLEVCDGCKLCTVICPANVLELYGPKTDLKVRLKDSASGCMSCNNCYAICAGKAIEAREPYDFVGLYRQQRIGPFAYPRLF